MIPSVRLHATWAVVGGGRAVHLWPPSGFRPRRCRSDRLPCWPDWRVDLSDRHKANWTMRKTARPPTAQSFSTVMRLIRCACGMPGQDIIDQRRPQFITTDIIVLFLLIAVARLIWPGDWPGSWELSDRGGTSSLKSGQQTLNTVLGQVSWCLIHKASHCYTCCRRLPACVLLKNIRLHWWWFIFSTYLGIYGNRHNVIIHSEYSDTYSCLLVWYFPKPFLATSYNLHWIAAIGWHSFPTLYFSII